MGLDSDLVVEGAGQYWQLSLFGTFCLKSPIGVIVPIFSRKVEGLLAVLAVNRPNSVQRDEVAEILWPGRPIDAQRSNFRQTLTHLRKVIGEDSVESSRVHCRLSPTFRVKCDFEEDPGGYTEPFMPNQDGDWFEKVRGRFEHNNEAVDRVTIVKHFSETLFWYAANNPRSLFDLLRSSAPMVKGVPYVDLLKLIQMAGDQHSMLGWAAYWKGASEEDLKSCARHLRFAFEEARKSRDVQLASEVCLELGKVYARTGRYERAMEVSAIADSIAAESNSPALKANASRLRGTILLTYSNHQRGLEQLKRSEDFIVDSLEKAIAVATRMFYLASSGQFSEAQEGVQWPSKIARDTGHIRIGVVTAMTQAIIAAHDSDRQSAIKKLEGVIATSRTLKNTQFRVYGEELMAKLYQLEGERGLSDGLLLSAKSGRQISQMAVTPLETHRVASVQ